MFLYPVIQYTVITNELVQLHSNEHYMDTTASQVSYVVGMQSSYVETYMHNIRNRTFGTEPTNPTIKSLLRITSCFQ
jgi:hypothetical protein